MSKQKELIKELFLQVGNDNGNSEHDIVIDGHLIQQPNVYSIIRELDQRSEDKSDDILQDIHNNLIISITSPKINGGLPQTYFVGNKALKSGKSIRNIEVGSDNQKLISPIPIISTLAHISGYAVKKVWFEDQDIKELKINVDMTTSLPVNQYKDDAPEQLSERFKGEHEVILYFGKRTVKCLVNFVFVKTIPEGVPSVFYLQTNPTKELLEEIEIENSEFFEDKKILHVAIGEGTTEYPITEDIDYNTDFLDGTANGVGIAIDKILQKFKADYKQPNLSRQMFSEYLKNPFSKWHGEATRVIMDELEIQAEEIYQMTKNVTRKAYNDVDIICVYGGGSILMKEFLKERLENHANEIKAKLVYLSQPHAVFIEALGMYEFTRSEIFENIKNEEVE